MSSLPRPATPDSPSSISLHLDSHTINDLTALSNFSRVPTPEPLNVSTCCCGKDDCETLKSWLLFKSKLESRLVLSAEVGQALLERHEAYVRRQKSSTEPSTPIKDESAQDAHVDDRVAELVKENAILQKRLTQALVNSEIAETSNKAMHDELQEARSKLSRLTAQQARAVGLETRLAAALQEKDDLQQERNSAVQKLKLAEARIGGLRERCVKLQAQVNRLREDLDVQRHNRQELSQEVLHDARQRLQQLQNSQQATVDDSEVTKVLESLVADNEALKRDNGELQKLLSESREELRGLQEEVEERRANTSVARHRHTESSNSMTFSDGSGAPLSPTFNVGTAPSQSVLHAAYRQSRAFAAPDRRAVSMERRSRKPFEPLTPETQNRPLSPSESEARQDVAGLNSYASSSHHSFEPDEDSHQEGIPTSFQRSRGVQTDESWRRGNATAPLTRPFSDSMSTSSPHDGHSESSSLTDGQSTVISALIDRIGQLLARLSQADALTLNNRLKRQRLLGADVSHLSRSTVSNILQEVTALRSNFRAFLEDDKLTTTCTRRDLRALLKLVKDIFSEMGQMRVTLNDVILDPSVALKVSDLALNPAKAESAEHANADASGASSAPSWMGPISKLLRLPGGAPSNADSAATRALSPPIRPRPGTSRVPSRIVPKREAALAASAMTVNVEFSGTAVGRAVTSTYSAHPEREDSISILARQTAMARSVSASASGSAQGNAQELSRSVMGIFAGAPAPRPEGGDPWVVVPRAARSSGASRLGAAVDAGAGAGDAATLGRSLMRKASSGKRLSRVVDAMIDTDAGDKQAKGKGKGKEQEGVPASLLERTLSRRGLSDSSIHTTFMQHGADDAEKGDAQVQAQSVLQVLGRKMSTFRFGSGYAPPAVAAAAAAGANDEDGGLSRPETPVSRSSASVLPARSPSPRRPRVSAPRPIVGAGGGGGLFSLSSWLDGGEAEAEAEAVVGASYMGTTPSVRGEEAYLHRTWTRERDF